MSEWLPGVLVSLVAGPATVVIGNKVLRMITWCSPRALGSLARVYVLLHSIPPTTLFRWRVGTGLQAVLYHPDTDEEEERPAGLGPDWQGPGVLFWLWGDRPRSAAFVARRVQWELLVRTSCFVLFFLGTFITLVRLSLTRDRLWLVALVFLAVHQVAVAATERYILWNKPLHYVVMAAGVFLYLRGGVLETVAVWVVGVHFVLSTLATWISLKSVWVREHLRLEAELRGPQPPGGS